VWQQDLRKLWSQLSPLAYDETTTILLDNHLEKFEGNPPGTCLLVPDFEPRDDNDQTDRVRRESDWVRVSAVACFALRESRSLGCARAQILTRKGGYGRSCSGVGPPGRAGVPPTSAKPQYSD
jgi:hypothetical protein